MTESRNLVHAISDGESRHLARWLSAGIAESDGVLRSNLDGGSNIVLGSIGATAGGRMQRAEIILVVVGEGTYRSSWINEEIAAGGETGLPIVAVKTKQSNVPPKALYGVEVIWAPT